MSKRTVITVESRMASSRLPGKNLKQVAGAPMLAQLLRRLKRSRLADVVCLATTRNPEDDALEAIARSEEVACYRGFVDDVLGRVLAAAESVGADVIAEITGDCPLSDPQVIDQAIARFRRGDMDYVANMLDIITYSVGFDVQVYSVDLLREIDATCQDPEVRVDVTPDIYHNGERYRLLNLTAPAPINRPRYRLCVDHAVDLEVIRAVYDELMPQNEAFGIAEIIALLDRRPGLSGRNIDVPDPFAGPSSHGKAAQEEAPMPADDPALRLHPAGGAS